MVGVLALTVTHRLWSGATALVCGVCLLAPASGSASTIFSAFVGVQNMTQENNNSPAPVSLAIPDGSYGAVDGGGSATASAGLSLGVSTATHVSAPPPGAPNQVEADATASFFDYEVIVSGPSGQSTTVSLNLIFHGLLSGGSGPPVDFGADALITTFLGGPGGQVSQGGSAFAPGGFFGTGASGLLAGWTNGSTFNVTTSSIPAMSGDHVLVDLSLADKAACGAAALTCTARADFSDTLGFPVGTPVFNLPAGWTVNSVDGSIVNNAFIAPEPSTWTLVAIPLVGLAFGYRRKP